MSSSTQKHTLQSCTVPQSYYSPYLIIQTLIPEQVNYLTHLLGVSINVCFVLMLTETKYLTEQYNKLYLLS